MRQKSFAKLVALIMVTVFLFTQTAFAAETVPASTVDLEYLKSIMEMIKQKYKGEVTDKQLIEGALKGMFDTMDPYTTYFTPDEASEFFNSMEGAYTGIGIVNRRFPDCLVVLEVFEGSPAQKAGLSYGDRIVGIDGQSVKDIFDMGEEPAGYLIGEAGSTVSLEIIKADGSKISKLELTRAKLEINPVKLEFRDGLAYIRIDTFNANTFTNIIKALKEVDAKKIEKVVLDLRSNTGGLVDQAVDVAKMLIPEGLIAKLEYKDEQYEDKQYYSHLKEQKYKLAVLVNGQTASASEILAGAVQDSKAGTLVGTKTYGKAEVQVTIPILTPEAYIKYEKQLGRKFVDASELINKYNIELLDSEVIGVSKITVGEYTTPKGRMISKAGLMPDIVAGDPQLVNDVNIFRIEKLQKLSKLSRNSESYEVYNAEMILKLAGYEVDTPDMKLDEKTENAIRKFQSDKGGYPGGVLDFTTQQWLNDKLDQLMLEVDKQYQKAVEVLNK